MAARLGFLGCALGLAPILTAYWFWVGSGGEAPAGHVWLTWVILLGGPAALTVAAGLLTRRSSAAIAWAVVGSVALSLLVVLLSVAVFFSGFEVAKNACGMTLG